MPRLRCRSAATGGSEWRQPPVHEDSRKAACGCRFRRFQPPTEGTKEKPLFNESKRWLDTGPGPLMGRRRVSDRSQGSHAPGSARVAVFVLPPLGGTTLVPIPRAGARAQGLLQGQGVRETLVRGLGQTS